MNMQRRTLILGLAVFTAVYGPHLASAYQVQEPQTDLQEQVFAEIEQIRRSKRPSVSQGRLTKGTLEHPAELGAPEGVGYYLAHPTRGTNFGHDRLVFGVMSCGVYLREQLGDHPDHRLRVHDLSSKAGGRQERHINHQMGLDVDLAFYATDLNGNVISSKWVSYGPDGTSTDGRRLFDAARNWEVVVGILRNEYFGEIRSILISDDLKKKLLTYAYKQLMERESEDETEMAELRFLIKRAESLMRQPKSSPHDNHFHLSLKNSNES